MNRYDRSLELMLFETNGVSAKSMLAAGIRHFIVDWECLGKTERQQDFDTDIAPVGPHELSEVSCLPEARVWCRINGEGPHSPREVEIAVGSGASGILLPMVRSPAEVERFLRLVDGRCQAGILVETAAAQSCVHSLAELPLDRVYFGLNDFAISRGGGSIFQAVLDGSVERAREAFGDVPFGFGGVTAVDSGDPVPCVRLIEEMARLDCSFVFLRRSFRRDVQRLGAARLTAEVAAYWQRCRARTPAEVERERREFERLLAKVCHAD